MTTLVGGRFELGRAIGAGGMGTVHEALDRETKTKVALKRLRSKEAVDLERFAREATVLAQLSHPGIVRYVAHSASGEDAWLAMEWLEGHTLAERLMREPLSIAETIALARLTAAALQVAHQRGFVHRDVKPANLFLEGGDPARTKVLDFGIARGVVGGHPLTGTGAAIGTPHYMSPEQARAERSVGARTDVYALGVVLFEALAGLRPFEGETPIAVLAKILLEEPPSLVTARPDVPSGLDALVRAMLAKDPAERPADGAAVLEALDALELQAPGVGLPPTRTSLRPALGEREQRLVCVVMVADVGRYGASVPTVLSTGELATDLQGELLELARAHGGQAELLADGSMVVTVAGRTGVVTDQADRAARLALAVRDVLPDAPIVVVAGRSVLTARLPAGEVVDRGASALRDVPTPRDGRRPVRIDDVVDGLLDDRFARDGKVGARVLLGVGLHDVPRRTLLGADVPIVGRKRELGTLRALYDEVIDEPVARVVLVTAPAGGGKTRLLHELLRELAGVSLGPTHVTPTVLLGRADAMRSAPHATLASAVRSAASLVEGEPLDVRRRKLAARIGEVASGADKARLVVFLGELLRVPFAGEGLASVDAARRDPQLMADGIRAALEDWLALECARRPVVLALEDLQWADRASLQTIDALLRHLEERAFFVVASARPEVDVVHPELFAERDRQDLHLTRLTRRSAARLVRAALPKADEALVARVVERGDGNAFLLEELVRAAARGESAMPDGVLGMAEARLAGLDPAARRVLRAASVFGGTFWSGGVTHLLGKARAGQVDVERWLARLAEDELVASSTTSTFAGEAEHRFRQALMRDAAYATLTEDDRRLGHRLAAEWLAQHDEREPDVLAEHYRLGGDPREAARWYAEAAVRAFEANDLDAVLDRTARGLDADELAPSVLGRLHLWRAEAMRWRGKRDDAAAHAEQALGALPGGSAEWYQALGSLLIAAGSKGDRDALRRWSALLAEQTCRDDDAARRERLVALCRAGHQHLWLGDRAGAEARFAAMLDLAELLRSRRAYDAIAEAWVETTRAAIALHAGQVSAYLDATVTALRAYDLAGDQRHACNQRVRLGYGWIEIGALEDAERELRAAFASAERLGLDFVAGFASQNLGWTRALRGDLAEAREHEQRALAIGQRLAQPAIEGGARFYLSRIALLAGDAAVAVAEAEAAERLVAAIPPLKVLCTAAKARASLRAGRTTDAVDAARSAVAARSELASMEEGLALVWLAALECDRTPEHVSDARAFLQRRLAGLREEHRAGWLGGGEVARLRELV
ncbi:MAG: protein kinase [Myxococcota bacterium]|nr:protein kinase [Myxococcota bacterium]